MSSSSSLLLLLLRLKTGGSHSFKIEGVASAAPFYLCDSTQILKYVMLLIYNTGQLMLSQP